MTRKNYRESMRQALAEPRKCLICGSTEGVRHFALTVDGAELNFSPHLCREHGDRFVFRAGVIMASLADELNLAVGRPAFEWAKAVLASAQLPPKPSGK